MYKLILLDADNTIFDYDKAEEFALFASLEYYNVPGDYKQIRTIYRVINQNLWKMLELGEVTKKVLKTLRFQKLFEELKLNINAHEFSDYYLIKLGEGNFLLDGAEELCRYLHNKYRVVFLTNGIKEVQHSRIKSSKVYKYTEDIITSDEVGINKPDRGIFQWAFDKLGYNDKKSTIIIGDSLGSDIQGGINFGIDTCWYNFTGEPNSSGLKPTYSIDSLKDIYSFL